jgi:hypothetical protein
MGSLHGKSIWEVYSYILISCYYLIWKAKNLISSYTGHKQASFNINLDGGLKIVNKYLGYIFSNAPKGSRPRNLRHR